MNEEGGRSKERRRVRGEGVEGRGTMLLMEKMWMNL